MSDLPNLYFRVRDNGASVFRLDAKNRDRRLELDQIATVNTNRGDYKVQGGAALSDAEKQAIEGWLKDRMTVLAARDLDDIHRSIDHMNMTAQWAQSKASDAELEAVTDKLLLAMHDLRSVLVRKKADRLQQED